MSTNAPTFAQQASKPVETILLRSKTFWTARAGLAELLVGTLSVMYIVCTNLVMCRRRVVTNFLRSSRV